MSENAPAAVFDNIPELWVASFPRPAIDTHKHARGRLSVVGGPMPNTGAARLAARAGLRIGAGTVRLLSPPDALLAYAIALEAVMVAAFRSPADLQAAAASQQAVVIGPAAGVGQTTRDNLFALAQTEAALVVDADALTSFESDPSELFALLGGRDVITPHAGEFERVFPGLLGETDDRVEAARAAAGRCGAVVILKGAGTVIAAPDGRVAVNGETTPYLATAGSGDVLAGIVGGLLAQAMPAFEAACAGAWIHGEAGRRLGPGLIAEDLAGQVPAVLRSVVDGK